LSGSASTARLDLRRRLPALLYPLFASWVIAAYIHGVQYLHIFGTVTGPAVWLLGIPVVPLELWLGSGWPPRMPFRRAPAATAPDAGRPARGRALRVAGVLLRVAFWLAFFAVWVVCVGWSAREQAKWLRWFAPEFYLQFHLVFVAEGWLTWIALGLWLAAYLLVTVRLQRLRIATTMILPMALALGLFFHLYEFGGIGGLFEGRVASQPGVKRIVDLRAANPRIPAHPRGICHDAARNALLVMFGCTYCDDDVLYPAVVRYDLATGDTRSFSSSNIRQVQCDDTDGTLLVAPWYRKYLHQLARADLSTQATHYVQAPGLGYWEPMSLLRDGDFVYIANDVEQAVAVFDLRTSRVTRVLDLVGQGLVRYGGPAWNLVQSRRTRRIYFTAGPGENLFEVEPETLRILKHRALRDVAGTGLELDEDRGVLYYQSGLGDELHEIDLDTFAVIRTFTGEGHARHVVLDRARNRLYVLGYFSGSVFALDRDSGRRVWTRRTGGLPHGMALAGDTLWVNSRVGVVELDLAAVERNP